MTHRIIIEFPNKALADQFCGQMSDGFGEGFCDFSFHRQKEGTDGKKPEDFERVKDNGLDVFYVRSIFI